MPAPLIVDGCTCTTGQSAIETLHWKLGYFRFLLFCIIYSKFYS